MEKKIYQNEMQAPSIPTRTNSTLKVTSSEDKITNVEKYTDKGWKLILDFNLGAIDILTSGNKIDLGEIIATDGNTVINKPELTHFIKNELTTWTLTIPEGTTEIAAGAFYNSNSSAAGYSFTSLFIPDSVESVGYSAFAGASYLTEVKYNPQTEFAPKVFDNTAISEILYNYNSVIHVPNKYEGEVIIPEGITTIPNECFRHRESITKITLPSTLTTLGEKAFTYCYALKELVFENSPIESLGQQWAIGSSVTQDTHTDVILKFDSVIPLIQTQGWDSNVNNYYVPDSLLNDYKSATNWSSLASKILPFSTLIIDYDYNKGNSYYHIGESATITINAKVKVGEAVITGVTCNETGVIVDSFNDNSFTLTVDSTYTASSAPVGITYLIGDNTYTSSMSVGIQLFADADAALSSLGALYVTTLDNKYANAEDLNASNEILQGILISDGTHSYVLNKDFLESPITSASAGSSYWGGYNIEIDPDHYFTASSTAKTDFDGIGNTQRIVAAVNENNHDNYFNVAPWSAAGLCNEFVFPYGNKGYLASAGEYDILVQKKNFIKKLIEDVNGTASNIFTYYMWSSTQYSALYAWSYNFNGSYWSNYYKGNNLYVVPVCAYPFTPSISFNCLDGIKAVGSSINANIAIEKNYDDIVIKSITSNQTDVVVSDVTDNSFKAAITKGSYSNVIFTVEYSRGEDYYTKNITVPVTLYDSNSDMLTALGACIEDSAGNLYGTAGAFKVLSANELQGITVSDGTHTITMGTECLGTYFSSAFGTYIDKWGGYDMEIDDDHYFNESSAAKLDFDGEGNTQRITAFLTENNHDEYFNYSPYSAAGLCSEYTFASGDKGYMPAAGELQMFVTNKDKILQFYSALGCTDLVNVLTKYGTWSSTQISALSAWYYSFSYSLWSNNSKDNGSYVVPVCASLSI